MFAEDFHSSSQPFNVRVRGVPQRLEHVPIPGLVGYARTEIGEVYLCLLGVNDTALVLVDGQCTRCLVREAPTMVDGWELCAKEGPKLSFTVPDGFDSDAVATALGHMTSLPAPLQAHLVALVHNTDIFFFTIFIIMAVASLVLRRVYVFVNRNSTIQNHESHLEMHAELKTYANVFYFFALLTVPIYAAYIVTEKFQMEPHVMEWLYLILRWTHVVFGIAWIGASFYFIFLENSLNRTENLRDELAGNLWAIHGGGFYYVEKYKSAPPILPKHLHWFKYEAYFTWLSGFLLLTFVYFMNAKAMMLDSSISNKRWTMRPSARANLTM